MAWGALSPQAIRAPARLCARATPLRAYAALFFATLWPPCGVHTLRSAAMCSGYALARIRRANNAELNDVLASVFQLVKVPLLFR